MVKLANTRGEIAVVFEHLRQGDDVREDFADGCAIIVNARRVRSEPAQKRRPARVAKWILAIGVIKANAARGQAINIRRLDQRMIVAAERNVEIVNRDEKNVE